LAPELLLLQRAAAAGQSWATAQMTRLAPGGCAGWPAVARAKRAAWAQALAEDRPPEQVCQRRAEGAVKHRPLTLGKPARWAMLAVPARGNAAAPTPALRRAKGARAKGAPKVGTPAHPPPERRLATPQRRAPAPPQRCVCQGTLESVWARVPAPEDSSARRTAAGRPATAAAGPGAATAALVECAAQRAAPVAAARWLAAVAGLAEAVARLVEAAAYSSAAPVKPSAAPNVFRSRATRPIVGHAEWPAWRMKSAP